MVNIRRFKLSLSPLFDSEPVPGSGPYGPPRANWQRTISHIKEINKYSQRWVLPLLEVLPTDISHYKENK